MYSHAFSGVSIFVEIIIPKFNSKMIVIVCDQVGSASKTELSPLLLEKLKMADDIKVKCEKLVHAMEVSIYCHTSIITIELTIRL